MPRGPLRPLRRHVDAADARHGQRGRLRHRELHEPRRRSCQVGRPGDRALPAPIGGAPPITSDPPFHNIARRLLLPPFAPKQIEPWEPEIRSLCHELLDADGRDHARRDRHRRRRPVRAEHPGQRHRPHARLPGEGRGAVPQVRARRPRADHRGAGHTRRPRRSRLLHRRPGQRAPREPARRSHELPAATSSWRATSCPTNTSPASIILLLIAGIDTTWSAIGSSIWHLAQHPEDHQRLLDDPEVMTFALEEFLRAYAPVTMARLVAKDNDFHGCPMKKDDWVLLPFPAANRDPKKFEDPDKFIVDREENRHAAFGLGIHRCLGSNLARLELKVAIEEFIKRFPRFELAGDTRWSVGQIRGPASSRSASSKSPTERWGQTPACGNRGRADRRAAHGQRTDGEQRSPTPAEQARLERERRERRQGPAERRRRARSWRPWTVSRRSPRRADRRRSC